jgi:hypothetical protein
MADVRGGNNLQITARQPVVHFAKCLIHTPRLGIPPEPLRLFLLPDPYSSSVAAPGLPAYRDAAPRATRLTVLL